VVNILLIAVVEHSALENKHILFKVGITEQAVGTFVVSTISSILDYVYG